MPKVSFTWVHYASTWNAIEVISKLMVSKVSYLGYVSIINKLFQQCRKGCFCRKEILYKFFETAFQKRFLGLWSSCCDCWFHWKLWTKSTYCCYENNTPWNMLYTALLIWLNQVSAVLFYLILNKIWKMDGYSWK